MVNIVAPLIAELLKHELEHLEVVVLLVTYNVSDTVKVVLLKALECSTQVLSHIYRCTIATEKKLLIKAVSSKVNPYRAILLTEEDTLLKTLRDDALTEKIGLRLVVNLIKVYAKRLVSYIKALVNPAVHGLPEVANLLVLSLPLAEHLLRLKEDWSRLLSLLLAHTASNKLLNLCLVVLVKLNVVVTNKVVTLNASALWCSTVTVTLPRNHRLTDVYTTVVYKVCLDNLVTVCSQNLRNRVTEKVITDMSKVEWFVCVWRRVLNHNGLAI